MTKEQILENFDEGIYVGKRGRSLFEIDMNQLIFELKAEIEILNDEIFEIQEEIETMKEENYES